MTVAVMVMATVRLAPMAQGLAEILQEVLQCSCKAVARTAARSFCTAGTGSA